MNVIDNAGDAVGVDVYATGNTHKTAVGAGGARLIVRGTGSEFLMTDIGITGLSFVGDGFDELGVAVDMDNDKIQYNVRICKWRNRQPCTVPKPLVFQLTGLEIFPACGIAVDTSVVIKSKLGTKTL